MLSNEQVLKILNKNEKKYTNEQVNKIKMLLYDFAQIAYLQFKQITNNEKSNIICKGVN